MQSDETSANAASGLPEHLYFNIGRSSCTLRRIAEKPTQFCFKEDDQIGIACWAQLEMAHADSLRMRLFISII